MELEEEMISDIKEIQPFFYRSIAEVLIEKGYRKESDTAREILTELYETKFKMLGEDYIYADNIKVFAKKYGVDLGE